MRLKSETEGIPLSSFEFALLCCLSEAGEGATVPEVKQYMWSIAGLTVSLPSIGQAMRRMEQICYVYSTERDDRDRPDRFGRMYVKSWRILIPGTDAVKAHIAWCKRVWRSIESSASEASEEVRQPGDQITPD
jgi:hypothetical protein